MKAILHIAALSGAFLSCGAAKAVDISNTIDLPPVVYNAGAQVDTRPSPLPNYENKGWSTEGTDSASHSYLGASALGVVTLARTPSPYIKLYAEAIAKYEYIPVFDSSLWVAADVLAAGSMTYAVEAVGPPGKVKAIVNAEAVATDSEFERGGGFCPYTTRFRSCRSNGRCYQRTKQLQLRERHWH